MKGATSILSRFSLAGSNAAQKITAVSTAFTAIRGMASDVARLGQAMIRQVRESQDFADSIDKVSQRLGFSAEGLQEYRVAAELAGIGQTKFDMAVQRSTRRIAEAAKGTGEAQDALRELGLDAQLLNRIGPEKALLKIADAMDRVPNAGNRLALAFKLFDSEGAAMVQLLGKGSAEVIKLREEARRLGLVLSNDAVAQLVASKDAMTLLEVRTKVLKASIAAELAPVLTTLSHMFLDVGEDGAIGFDKLREAVDLSARAIGTLGDALNVVIGSIRLLANMAPGAFKLGTSGAQAGAATFLGVMGQILPESFGMARAAREQSNRLRVNALQNFAQGAAGLGQATGTLTDPSAAMAQILAGLTGEFSSKLLEGLDEQRTKLLNRSRSTAGGGSTTDIMRDVRDELRDIRREIQDRLSQQPITQQQVGKMLQLLESLRGTIPIIPT